jgi:Fe-S-cluster containining protein
MMETDTKSIASLGLTSEQRKAVGFLAEFTKRMVVMAFPGPKTPANALSLIQEVYRFTDDMLSGCLLKSETQLPCKQGCFWCCYLRVKVTPLEVMGLVAYVRAHLEPGEISALRQRLIRTDDITRGMDGYQRLGAKQLCPLLVDGSCLAYPVRPIACRVYHSLNLSDCQALLGNANGRVTIRRDISGLSLGILAGLTEGLRAAGLQPRLLELIAGLRVAMQDPGSGLVQRWLGGEPAFEEAVVANAKEIESFHRALVEELGEALG